MTWQGGPKVVAALALVLLATPPVVNAIMSKAAQQADTRWLRDEGDIPLRDDVDVPADLPPQGAPRAGDADLDPPPRCEPRLRGPPPATIEPPIGLGGGQLTLATEPGDVAVLVRVEGRDVTGRPSFTLLEGTRQRWAHGDLHARESLSLPAGAAGAFQEPRPGVTWTLRWDVQGTLHSGIALSLAAQRCGGAP